MNAVVNKVMENKHTRKGKLIFCQFKSEIAHLKNRLSAAGFNVAVIRVLRRKRNASMLSRARFPQRILPISSMLKLLLVAVEHPTSRISLTAT